MIAALLLAATVAIPPRPVDYITDNAGALSPSAAQQIESELRTYERTTLHHVIVWIGQTTGDDPLEDWTIRAAERWKIGRKGVDDGAILFLFMRDHKVRIEVGYGLESTLTDASAGEIIRNAIVPKMRAGDVDGAVRDGVDRILLTIAPSFTSQIGHTVAAPHYQPPVLLSFVVMLIPLVFFVGFIGLFAFALIVQKRQATSYGGSDPAYADSSGSSSGGSDDSGSSGGDFGGGGASGSW